jgi:tryptophanyl-tRNA synthetase
VSNLLAILAACTGESPETLAGKYAQYGPLKADTAAAVVEFLRPVQQRFRELEEDRGHVRDVLAKGAMKAQTVAGPVLERARTAVGLLDR